MSQLKMVILSAMMESFWDHNFNIDFARSLETER